MHSLYLKNYKGFKEEIINLKDINFLVGENSTGKTSILKIINILSSQEFWFNGEFNNSDVELGYFDEIINQNSQSKTFSIGIEKNDNDKEGRDRRVLFEFNEEDNVPKAYKIKISFHGYDAILKFSKKQIQYKYKKSLNLSFSEWVNDFDFHTKTKKLNLPGSKLPVSFILSVVEDEVLGDKIEIKDKFNIRAYPLFHNYLWLAPIRAKAKRIYESYKIKFSPEGEHIPSLLRKLVNKAKRNKDEKILKTLEQFGRESNLFDKIEITELGRKNSSPFEINILYHNLPIKLPNVGYGVSQSLPLVIEILSSKNCMFSVQQPEVHLHPKAQAAFGSFVYNSFLSNNNQFIIETHSDFTINRFRYEMLQNQTEDADLPTSQVLFFERNEDGTKLTPITIESDGSYSNVVPSSFREFFIDEELKLLEI